MDREKLHCPSQRFWPLKTGIEVADFFRFLCYNRSKYLELRYEKVLVASALLLVSCISVARARPLAPTSFVLPKKHNAVETWWQQISLTQYQVKAPGDPNFVRYFTISNRSVLKGVRGTILTERYEKLFIPDLHSGSTWVGHYGNKGWRNWVKLLKAEYSPRLCNRSSVSSQLLSSRAKVLG